MSLQIVAGGGSTSSTSSSNKSFQQQCLFTNASSKGNYLEKCVTRFFADFSVAFFLLRSLRLPVATCCWYIISHFFFASLAGIKYIRVCVCTMRNIFRTKQFSRLLYDFGILRHRSSFCQFTFHTKIVYGISIVFWNCVLFLSYLFLSRFLRISVLIQRTLAIYFLFRTFYPRSTAVVIRAQNAHIIHSQSSLLLSKPINICSFCSPSSAFFVCCRSGKSSK